MTDENLPARQNNSIVQVKIGNNVYDAVFEPRCKVCNHPARFTIEEKLLLGNSYPKIARWVSDVRATKPSGEQVDWPELEARNIKNHYVQGHCPLDAEMMRAFTERRAEELGEDLEESMTTFTDHIVVQKAILSKGYEALVKGEIQPDVKDTLAASKLLADREREIAGQASVEEWQDFMQLYFSVVRQVVAPEQWTQIVSDIQQHPVMKQMQRRKTIEGRVEDA